LSKAGTKLRFDFAIFDNNQLLYLIEFQGVQHFKSGTGWNTEEKLIKTIEHDILKLNYCSVNKIPLFVITYKDNIEEKIEDITNLLATG